MMFRNRAALQIAIISEDRVLCTLLYDRAISMRTISIGSPPSP